MILSAKPIPKEVVIKQSFGPIFYITATAPDAQQRVRDVCPEFGQLVEIQGKSRAYTCMFVVGDEYDIDEVIAYLKRIL